MKNVVEGSYNDKRSVPQLMKEAQSCRLEVQQWKQLNTADWWELLLWLKELQSLATAGLTEF